jgi:inorganic pyrophosphatase
VRVGKWGDAADAHQILLEAIERAKEEKKVPATA